MIIEIKFANCWIADLWVSLPAWCFLF